MCRNVQLSEREAFVGIVGTRIEAPRNPLNITAVWYAEGGGSLRASLNRAPIMEKKLEKVSRSVYKFSTRVQELELFEATVRKAHVSQQ